MSILDADGGTGAAGGAVACRGASAGRCGAGPAVPRPGTPRMSGSDPSGSSACWRPGSRAPGRRAAWQRWAGCGKRVVRSPIVGQAEVGAGRRVGQVGLPDGHRGASWRPSACVPAPRSPGRRGGPRRRSGGPPAQDAANSVALGHRREFRRCTIPWSDGTRQAAPNGVAFARPESARWRGRVPRSAYPGAGSSCDGGSVEPTRAGTSATSYSGRLHWPSAARLRPSLSLPARPRRPDSVGAPPRPVRGEESSAIARSPAHPRALPPRHRPRRDRRRRLRRAGAALRSDQRADHGPGIPRRRRAPPRSPHPHQHPPWAVQPALAVRERPGAGADRRGGGPRIGLQPGGLLRDVAAGNGSWPMGSRVPSGRSSSS